MTSNKEYSSDELNPPEWLNKAFFSQVVRDFSKDPTVIITKLALRPGTSPGEHYASVMFRAEVTYDTKSKQNQVIKLIMKTMPFEEGKKKEFLQESTAFKTEMRMYEEVLPAMQKVLSKINDNTKIAPTLVYKTNEPSPIIIFIDETPNGFNLYTDPLNLEQVQVVIERIAKFHACSIYFNENGFDMTTFNDCPYNKNHNMKIMETFIVPNMRNVVKTIQEWENCEDIANVLQKNLTVFEDRLHEMFMNKEKQMYQVLVHGDFQNKNMIYRNDGLKSDDFLLLDFQFCYWNSPAIDILGLLCNVCDENVRLNHRNEVITKYFYIFKETLVKLNFKGEIPSLLELQMELMRCGLLEYAFIVLFTPFFQYENRIKDINEMMETMDFHGACKEIFKKEDFRINCLKRLRELNEMGVFE